MRIVEQKAKYFSPATRKLDAASRTQINANINEILCDFKSLVQAFFEYFRRSSPPFRADEKQR